MQLSSFEFAAVPSVSKAQVTALLMLSEVVIATGSSFVLGAAHPTPMVWLGGALIMLTALLAVRH